MNHPTTIRAALKQAMKWQTLVLIKEAVLQNTAKGKELNITKEMLSEAHDKALETALQDITRIVEEVIGEDEEVPRPQDEESRDRFYRKSGQNFLRNQLKTKLRKVLK